MAFSFDTTLGVGIAVAVHKLVLGWAKRRHAARIGASSESWAAVMAECGNYGEDHRFHLDLCKDNLRWVCG